MSETVSLGQEDGQQAEVLAAREARETRGRGRWVTLGMVVVLAAGTVWAWRAGVFSPAAPSGAHGAPAPATAAVTRQDLSATTPVTATLGYAGSYQVTGQGGGMLTWLPSQGQVIRQGQALYKTDNGSPVWPSGNLSSGQVVFEPTALRVSQLTGSLGGPTSGPVLTATSNQHAVTIPLDASQQSEVKVGDTVTVTLPNGTTTPGVVSSVGTVATTTTGTNGNPSTTIPVTVRLVHPSAAGTLDQAPVTVNITTATADDVLVVPVGALLAQSSGGYDVEVAGPGSTRRYVPVTPGIFDDADGLVQVTGALAPGQRVVVAAS